MMNNLIIRRDKIKEIILYCNSEKVYFLSRYGKIINNSLDYDKISDQFDNMVKENF